MCCRSAMRDHASGGRRILERVDEFDIIYFAISCSPWFQNMLQG